MVKADGSHEWRNFKDAVPDLPRPDKPDDLGKVGARNNAEDQARIQAMHDASVDLGATCVAHKFHGPQPADLAKQFDRLTDMLSKTIADLGSRLKAVEEQPQPLPFAMQARAVAKHEDGVEHLESLLDDPNTLSLLAIKLAQRQGR